MLTWNEHMCWKMCWKKNFCDAKTVMLTWGKWMEQQRDWRCFHICGLGHIVQTKDTLMSFHFLVKNIKKVNNNIVLLLKYCQLCHHYIKFHCLHLFFYWGTAVNSLLFGWSGKNPILTCRHFCWQMIFHEHYVTYTDQQMLSIHN